MKKLIKWPIKAIVNNFKYFRDLSLYLLTRKRQSEKPLIRYYKEGLILPSYDRPVCFFCSYDKENVVRENVYYYLEQLALAGFDIVFISSSDAISDADLKKLSECCIKIISRENKGYDFYSWKTGLEKYPQHISHKGLLLANDSVLGPLFSIKDIIARLENHGADIVGMTDCFLFYPHLQSYFLYCKNSVIVSEEFIGFFKRVDVLELKMAIIRRYEVGFSRSLGRRFKLSALYNLESVVDPVRYIERPKKWIEPTSHFWKPLITEFKFPFLKKSLLTRRGVSIEKIAAALAESGSTYDVDILTDWIGRPAYTNIDDHKRISNTSSKKTISSPKSLVG
ncbi:MAG: rhamnan synthesis F family protein [Pseudomonadota bacterium]|nr:rhamnan synthesis F family protein [Pseudomonadota bacterium]